MFNHISFNKNSFDRQEILVSSDFIISSYGNAIANFLITYNLTIELDENNGGISEGLTYFEIITPLIISIISTSKVDISKFGNIDISYIYLQDIILAPGEEIIIDTDLFISIINGVTDVSSITSESNFFELGPGINNLIFYPEYENYPDPIGNELEISLIWQNRWL